MADKAKNLDRRVQDIQLRVGVAVLGATMAAAVGLLGLGASTLLRALLFGPFFIGTYAVISGLSGTCVFTAFRGRRQTFEGSEPMAKRDDVLANRRRGLSQLASVVALSLVATTLLLAAH
jgi:hypothetical protein